MCAYHELLDEVKAAFKSQSLRRCCRLDEEPGRAPSLKSRTVGVSVSAWLSSRRRLSHDLPSQPCLVSPSQELPFVHCTRVLSYDPLQVSKARLPERSTHWQLRVASLDIGGETAKPVPLRKSS